MLTHDDEMPFGKHKGTKMKDVPRAYLRYIFKKFGWGTMKPMGADGTAVHDYIWSNKINQ